MIQVTQEDEREADKLFHATLDDIASYSEWGLTTFREVATRRMVQAIAQARHEGRIAAREEAARLAESMALSGFRIGEGQCAIARQIRNLKEPPVE